MKLLALCFALLIPFQAIAAISGTEYLSKMNKDQKFGYMNGALDMAIYQLVKEKKGNKAECVINWYFKGNGPTEAVNVLSNHKDLPVAAVLTILIKRNCGNISG